MLAKNFLMACLLLTATNVWADAAPIQFCFGVDDIADGARKYAAKSTCGDDESKNRAMEFLRSEKAGALCARELNYHTLLELRDPAVVNAAQKIRNEFGGGTLSMQLLTSSGEAVGAGHYDNAQHILSLEFKSGTYLGWANLLDSYPASQNEPYGACGVRRKTVLESLAQLREDLVSQRERRRQIDRMRGIPLDTLEEMLRRASPRVSGNESAKVTVHSSKALGQSLTVDTALVKSEATSGL